MAKKKIIIEDDPTTPDINEEVSIEETGYHEGYDPSLPDNKQRWLRS